MCKLCMIVNSCENVDVVIADSRITEISRRLSRHTFSCFVYLGRPSLNSLKQSGKSSRCTEESVRVEGCISYFAY